MPTPNAFDAYALLLGNVLRLREWRGPDESDKVTEISAAIAYAILGYWAGHRVEATTWTGEYVGGKGADWIFVKDANDKSVDERPAIVFSGPTEGFVKGTMAKIDEHVEWKHAEPVTGAALFDKCASMLAYWRTIEAKHEADAGSEKVRRRLSEKGVPPPPGTMAAQAYEAAKVSPAFQTSEVRNGYELNARQSSFKSLLIKLKDKRFHLCEYAEHHEGSERAYGWKLMGDVLGEAYFCNIDDLTDMHRYIFSFVVPAATALVKPTKKA